VTALAPHVRPKVARVIAMLATDHDGEALAAVRALHRVLDANGLDLNDLAAVIEGRQTAQDRPGRQEPHAEAMLKALLASAVLTPWERGYCSDLARLIYRGEALTPGQIAKLREIFDQRVGGAA